MAKRKIGLHKELSTILNGASIPKNNNGQQSDDSAPNSVPLKTSPLRPMMPPPSQPPGGRPTDNISSKAIDKLRIQQAKADGIAKLFKQIPWQIFHSRAIRSELTANPSPSTDIPPHLSR